MSSIYTEDVMGNKITIINYTEFLGRSIISKLSYTKVPNSQR